MATPKALIIGGGISGLCLAHGFKKHNIPFHVYERDRSQDFRAQGYRIRLGGKAVEALEYLLDEPTKATFELTCADMRIQSIPEIDAQTGQVNEGPSRPGTVGKAYTVDRTLFRSLLIRGLGLENITYGKTFTRYSSLRSDPESITAHFSDGTSSSGSLLIGADGARSPVRTQLLPSSSHSPVDTGGRCIYGKTPIDASLLQVLNPKIMSGMCAIKDRSQDQLMSMVLEPITFPYREEIVFQGFECPQNYIYWVLASRPKRMGFGGDGEQEEEEEDDGDGGERKEGRGTGSAYLSLEESELRAREVTRGWDPSVRVIIERQEKGQTAALPISSVRPEIERWEPEERVTLIGDAVHLMGPTAGSGAITAIQDAYVLCKLLKEEGQSKRVIGKYEEEMRGYAGKNVELSWMAAKNIFGMKGSEERSIAEVMMEVREKRGR